MRRTEAQVEERLFEQFKEMLSQKFYGKRLGEFTEEDRTELKKEMLAIFMREFKVETNLNEQEETR